MAKKSYSERNLKFETLQLHVGQEQPDPVTDARAVPIYLTSSYVFHNSQHAADRFGLKDAGNIYGRLTNPTEDVFEKRIAALEGGVAALAVGSGAAALAYAFQALAHAGDHIVAAKNIYGGTYNLLAHTLPDYGIEATFVDPFDYDAIEAAIKPNTKAVQIETLGNPNSEVVDIERIAKIAHAHNIPLVVDNTFATPVDENPAVKHFQKVAAELKVVLPISFYERDINVFYNTVAVIDADGSILGIYRKTHIPDDHYYQEKFYFTPGDTGFKVWDTRYARIGVGICWDQWFPETARGMAVQGAEILFYPTAIGSEPILEVDSMPHWRRCMQGHSACNIVPVVAANRIGEEKVAPSEANGHQESSLIFYGSSFVTDATGEIVTQASRDKEEIVYGESDLDADADLRVSWGLFRDRRPEIYKSIR